MLLYVCLCPSISLSSSLSTPKKYFMLPLTCNLKVWLAPPLCSGGISETKHSNYITVHLSVVTLAMLINFSKCLWFDFVYI